MTFFAGCRVRIKLGVTAQFPVLMARTFWIFCVENSTELTQCPDTHPNLTFSIVPTIRLDRWILSRGVHRQHMCSSFMPSSLQIPDCPYLADKSGGFVLGWPLCGRFWLPFLPSIIFRRHRRLAPCTSPLVFHCETQRGVFSYHVRPRKMRRAVPLRQAVQVCSDKAIDV